VPDHECNDDGEPIYYLRDGSTIRETDKDFDERIAEICGGSVTCSICGSSAMERDAFGVMAGD